MLSNEAYVTPILTIPFPAIRGPDPRKKKGTGYFNEIVKFRRLLRPSSSASVNEHAPTVLFSFTSTLCPYIISTR